LISGVSQVMILSLRGLWVEGIKVILIAASSESRKEYIKAIERFNVHVDVVDSILEAYEKHGKTRYNGFLVDVATLLRSSAADKAEANLLIDNFPVLRLSFKASNGIRCIPTGKYSGLGNSLEEFLRDNCSKFVPRSLKGTKRGTKVLNVLLNRDLNSPTALVEKSVTINFSSEGAFFYSVARWKKDDLFWAVFKELSDRTPIKAQVKRVVPWGKTDSTPGIGVKFLNMSEEQIDQLEDLIEGKKV